MLAELLSALKFSVQVTSWGMKAAERASQLKAPTVDAIATIALEGFDPTGDDELVLTTAQAADIDTFLQDPAVATVLRTSFMALMASAPEDRVLAPFTDGSIFLELVENWHAGHSEEWRSLGTTLWADLHTTQQRTLSRVRHDGLLSLEAQDAIVHRYFFGVAGRQALPGYLKTIIDLSKSFQAQQALQEYLVQCRQSRTHVDDDKFTVQGIEDDSVPFDSLYVDRTLVDASTGDVLTAASQLNIFAANPRAIVVGDPGVGKSTLTSWVQWRLRVDSNREDEPLVVTLTSRHVLTDPKTSLVSALREQLDAKYQSNVSAQTFEALLATGLVVLLVDGLDEILDATQRRRIVDQLHTFAERFPLISILCTTRRSGFEVALFKTATFRMLHLEEYTDSQVTEYAEKWFSRFPNEVRARRFLGESRSLGELRQNPLMLALLCTLFRQYDYIPRSRREVYLRCAALMFHEWDPRRGIAIPNLFKNEGEVILRDIALLLHQAGGVSQSIEESQLERLVATYLTDKGEEPIQARSAAKQLLQYCSGRAWILSKVGGTSGENRFSFTHRTFFEFFASEAIVRKINHNNMAGISRPQGALRMTALAETIYRTYQADSTSVMPELLLQAADDLMGGVSTQILSEIQNEAARSTGTVRAALTSLAVRLIASAGVSLTVAERVFVSLIADWKSPATAITTDRFRPILDISSGHRSKLIQMLEGDSVAALAFLGRYARIEFLGESGLFSDDWRNLALHTARLHAAQLGKDTFTAWFGFQVGVLDLDSAILATPGSGLMALTVEGRDGAGLLWYALADTQDMHQRKAVWRHAKKAILEEGALDDPRLREATEFLDAIPGTSESCIELEDVVILLALALGPESYAALQEKLPNENPVALARGIADARFAVDESQRRLKKTSSTGERQQKASDNDSVRRALDKTFRKHRRSSAPKWAREYVGI